MGAPIPRIQGNAVKKGNYWSWIAWVSFGESEECLEIRAPENLQFLNKKSAIKSLRKHAQEIANTISKEVMGQQPTGYLDLKRNMVVKSLDESETDQNNTTK